MGWYGTYGSRADAEAEALRGKSVIDKVPFTERTWSVISPDGQHEPYILLVLFQKREDGWWYKPIDESMGPFYYDCPEHFFTLAPKPYGAVSREWRARCLALLTRDEASRKLGTYR